MVVFTGDLDAILELKRSSEGALGMGSSGGRCAEGGRSRQAWTFRLEKILSDLGALVPSGLQAEITH